MAIITNTYQSSSGASKQNRENIISETYYTTDPTETPLFASISRQTVKAIDPSWVQTSLRTPDPDNANLEGDQYTYNALNQPVRVKDYTQIFRDSGIVSNTQEAVDKVGKDDVERSKLDVAIQIRRDVEAAYLSNNASVAGTTRKLGGLRAWIKTNDIIAAGGASGGYNTGTGVVDAATNGTNQRTFTKTLMDAALMAAYSSGGNPTMAFVSPYAKSVFSGFMNDANVAGQMVTITNPSKQATIVGAADAYRSDWGLIDFVPNRIMALVPALARNAFFVDTSMLATGVLRDIKEDKDVVSNADATPFVVIGELTLIVRHEKAHAVVADIFGLTSST